MLQFLLTVTNPPSVKDVRLIPKAIEDWEAKKASLEKEFGEQISEKLAAAIFTAMLPQNFQDMIFESQGTADLSYQVIRDKVLGVAGSRIQQSQPVPMDIGAVDGEVRCQPCGGADIWGSSSYSEETGVDIDAVKGGGKGMQCYRCSGYGHMAKDCGTPVSDKGNPKGGGKGFGKFGGGKGYEGKGYGKETRECYNCKKLGHLAKDCWAKGGGKGGKAVNEVSEGAQGGGEVSIGGVWMIAEVEALEGKPLSTEQLQEIHRRRVIPGNPISLQNRFSKLYDDDDDEDEDAICYSLNSSTETVPAITTLARM